MAFGEREFALGNTFFKSTRQLDDAVFAVNRDEIGQRREQRSICHLFWCDAGVGTFIPGGQDQIESLEIGVQAIFFFKRNHAVPLQRPTPVWPAGLFSIVAANENARNAILDICVT